MKAPIIKVEHIVAEEGVSLIDNDISYIILMMERLIKKMVYEGTNYTSA